MGRATSSEPPLKVPYQVPLCRVFLLVPLHGSFSPTPPLRFIFFDSFNLIRSSRVMHFISLIRLSRFCSFPSIHSIRYSIYLSWDMMLNTVSVISVSSAPTPPLTYISTFETWTLSLSLSLSFCVESDICFIPLLHLSRFCSFSSIHSIVFVHFELFTSFHLLGSSLRFVLFVTFSSLQSFP
jgi:hypothetical protein